MFLPVILSKLKSQKDFVRNACIELTGAIAKKCKSPDTVQTMLEGLKNYLEGKHGVLSQFYQRECGFRAIHGVISCYHSLSMEEANALAVNVFPILAKAIDKEAHDDTRWAGLECLVDWIVKSGHLSNEVLSLLKKGLANTSKTSTLGYLLICQSICAQSSNEVLLQALSNVAPMLLEIVQISQKKPATVHLDGILALSALLKLLSSIASVDQMVQKENLLSLLYKGGESFFLRHIDQIIIPEIDNKQSNAEERALGALPYIIFKGLEFTSSAVS